VTDIPRRLLAAATAIVVGLVPLAAGAPAAAQDTPSPTVPATSAAAPARTAKTFVLGIKQDIDSFNPYVGVVASAFEVYRLMYDELTGISDKDFSPTPAIAEGWDTSTDGLTWTFRIRRGVKWSDGRDLTAKDVVYSFQRVVDGETENGQYGNYLTTVTKIEATDDYTVVFTTSEPSPSMLSMAIPILPEHIWKDIDGDEVATFANTDKPVGSGPFQLVEVQTNQFYRFAANKNYWAGAAKVDEVIFRIFADDEALTQALKKGEVDMVQDISAQAFEALANTPGITTSDSKYSGFNELAFNLGAQTVDNKPIGDGHPALKDKQVRLAIDHAIDRKTLVDKVLRNHGTVATGVIPPIYANDHWNPGGAARAFDVAKANSILDTAGYPKGSDGVRAGPDGRKLQFRLFGREESETSKRDVEYIRDWLSEIGITATVQIMSEDALTSAIGEGEFDLFEWGWVVEPDPDFQLSVFTCDQRSTESDGEISAGWSDSFYCNAAYDALYLKQKSLIDAAARRAVIKQAQQMLYEDVAYSMLFYYNSFEAYRSDRFTGFVHQPTDGGVLVFQYGTYSYRNIEPVDPNKLAAEQDSAANRTWLILGSGLAALLLVVAVAIVVTRRRRTTADERE
jgi:peptide/nickel transport system substrate-binding protein